MVVCLRRQSPFRETLAGSDGVHIFGILDEACQPSAIESDSIVDRAARAIHEGYLAEARANAGESRQTNKSLVPWQELPQHLKESNYAQAEHMGRKLQEIGAVLVGDRPREPFEFTAEELQRLARLEHARWMEERLAAGFVHGPRRRGGSTRISSTGRSCPRRAGRRTSTPFCTCRTCWPRTASTSPGGRPSSRQTGR